MHLNQFPSKKPWKKILARILIFALLIFGLASSYCLVRTLKNKAFPDRYTVLYSSCTEPEINGVYECYVYYEDDNKEIVRELWGNLSEPVKIGHEVPKLIQE